jgi:hypothetical protein
VLREQAELMPAVELGVLSHSDAAVEDHEVAPARTSTGWPMR